MGNVLYERRYPKQTMEDLKAEAESSTEQLENMPKLSYQEFMERIYRNRVSVRIPEREKAASTFIRIARWISEFYELDIKITKHTDHISANYYFNSSGGLRHLREVVKYADDISFFTNINGYDIVMCIDFYTHAVFLNGRLMHP